MTDAEKEFDDEMEMDVIVCVGMFGKLVDDLKVVMVKVLF